MNIDWDDPAARLRLVENVGPEEYNRRLKEHHDKSVVATVNGYGIRPVNTRWGRLFHVDGLNSAFYTLDEATAFANEQPAKELT